MFNEDTLMLEDGTLEKAINEYKKPPEQMPLVTVRFDMSVEQIFEALERSMCDE